MKDYYKILNVDEKATQDEIKKAYRKIAMKYHPDKNEGDVEAENKFKEAVEAYEILGNEEKRKKYDLGGDSDFLEEFRKYGFSGFRRQYEPINIINKEIICDISLEDYYFKKDVTVSFERFQIKKDSKKVCSVCDGSGFQDKEVVYGSTRMIHRETCGNCFGDGVFYERISEKLTKKINCFGDGILNDCGDQMGDLRFGSAKVIFKIKKDENFQISEDGTDLVYNAEVPLINYMLGDELIIPHFDGKLKVKYKSKGKVFDILRVKSKGLPFTTRYNTNGKGNLLIRVVPKIPTEFNKEEISILNKLKKCENF